MEERHLLLFLLFLQKFGFQLLVLLDISQLSLVHKAALLWSVIHEDPEAHPDETQDTDDDKGEFPADGLRDIGDSQRCYQCADRSAGIEDRCREGPVPLREVFRRNLDSYGEVTCLANRQDTSGSEEEIHADR